MQLHLSRFQEELFYVRCACHIVNLVVKDGLDLVQESIEKIRQFIVYLFNSTSRVTSFKILCRAYEKDHRYLHLMIHIGEIPPI